LQIFDDSPASEDDFRPTEDVVIEMASQKKYITLTNASLGVGIHFKKIDIGIVASPNSKEITWQMLSRLAREKLGQDFEFYQKGQFPDWNKQHGIMQNLSNYRKKLWIQQKNQIAKKYYLKYYTKVQNKYKEVLDHFLLKYENSSKNQTLSQKLVCLSSLYKAFYKKIENMIDSLSNPHDIETSVNSWTDFCNGKLLRDSIISTDLSNKWLNDSKGALGITVNAQQLQP